jgi:hypothetical protein
MCPPKDVHTDTFDDDLGKGDGYEKLEDECTITMLFMDSAQNSLLPGAGLISSDENLRGGLYKINLPQIVRASQVVAAVSHHIVTADAAAHEEAANSVRHTHSLNINLISTPPSETIPLHTLTPHTPLLIRLSSYASPQVRSEDVARASTVTSKSFGDDEPAPAPPPRKSSRASRMPGDDDAGDDDDVGGKGRGRGIPGIPRRSAKNGSGGGGKKKETKEKPTRRKRRTGDGHNGANDKVMV